MIKPKYFLILFSLIFTFNTIKAQKNNFEFYSIEDGLPHSTIYSLFQDSRSYLWIGSEGGGVSRFDGKKFYNYNKKNGLKGNTIRDIFEDKDKNIWFATDAGVTYYDGYKVKSYDEKQGLSSPITFCINQDNSGKILVGTAQGGLNIIDIKTDSIKSYTTADGLNSNNVFATICDSLNRIWLFYYRGDPQIINIDNDTLIITDVNVGFYDLSVCYTGQKDSKGNIWIGTQNNGVFKISNYKNINELNIEAYDIMHGLSDNCVWDISCGPEKVIVGTSSGVNIIHNNDKIEKINTKTGLLSDQILAVLTDSEGDLWLSMMENGLAKLKGNEFSHFSINDGLESNEISCIKQLRDSSYMISTYDKGISIYDINSNKVTLKASLLKDRRVSAFDLDSQDNLWVGTTEGLVLVNERQTTLFDDSYPFSPNRINDILVDSRDIIWMATFSGIAYFDGKEFNTITAEMDQLINDEVQSVVEDKSGDLWFGTLGGLVRYNLSKGIYQDFNEEDGLDYTKIHALAVDKYDNIWIGTYGDGLYYFDKSKDSNNISHILTDTILLSNNIYSLAVTDKSELIVGTDKGFTKVYILGENTVTKAVNYNKERGFKFIENNQNAICYSPISNAVLFGTTGGLSIYYPDKENTKKSDLKIHLSKIKLFNREVDWSKKFEINRWGNTPKELELNYKKNFLTFVFNGISLKDPKGLKYEYKLEGQSNIWVTTNQNELVFPSLPYGDYTLHIKAVNSMGYESNKPLIYKFIIHPPIYLRWWFILLSIIFVIISVFLFFRWRMAKLVKDKHILELTVSERTAEVVSQKNIIERKNRDITDSINYAQRIQNALLPSDEKLSSYFDEYFVLFRPKDIVSGDFYWANTLNNKILFTAADCTGHGVPGSIVSIIGNNGLENVIQNNTDVTASEVLEQHTDFVIDRFRQSGDAQIKDGMDMALCIFDKENMKLEFSGAHNPLYLIRAKAKGFDEFLNQDLLKLENEEYNLFEIKADKQPVGDFEYRKPFTNNKIDLLKGDTIYLFSDGFADQFGGPKGKKYKYKPFKRLILSIQEKSMSEQSILLEKSIVDWMNFDGEEYEQIDDIIIFSVRF